MSYNFDGIVRSGTQSFQTSHGLDSIYQMVDLFSNGHTTTSMESSPDIRFSLWYATRGDQAGQYYVKFSLLRQDGVTVVTSTNVGSPDSLIPLTAGIDWTEVSYTFSTYETGVRYARIEFGGQDQSVWAGHYGTHFDDASITVEDASTLSASSNHGSTMPGWGYAPPTGPFGIRLSEGDTSTHATEVTLQLLASPDVNRMAISRYQDFRDTGIVPFSPSLNWSLCGSSICPEGAYDVYAKFYQSYGVSSPLQHLVITYSLPSAPIAEEASSTTTLNIAQSPPPSPAFFFSKNLREGDKDSEVKNLQIFLNTHGHLVRKQGNGSPGKETDVFGPALKQALMQFQEAHKEKLLTPLKREKGTGIFGNQTRAFVNEMVQSETREAHLLVRK